MRASISAGRLGCAVWTVCAGVVPMGAFLLVNTGDCGAICSVYYVSFLKGSILLEQQDLCQGDVWQERRHMHREAGVEAAGNCRLCIKSPVRNLTRGSIGSFWDRLRE